MGCWSFKDTKVDDCRDVFCSGLVIFRDGFVCCSTRQVDNFNIRHVSLRQGLKVVADIDWCLSRASLDILHRLLGRARKIVSQLRRQSTA